MNKELNAVMPGWSEESFERSGMATMIKDGKELAPHQQRVVAERDELNAKFDKLTEFLKGDLFKSLPADERERLTRQHAIMEQYSNVLAERIVHF